MQEKTIDSFQALHALIFESSFAASIIFRGVTNEAYELVPKIARPPFEYTSQREQAILRLFRMHAPPFLDRLPTTTWEWLSLAQHHGLPTRLLDWTRNPLVAAYFAVEHHYDTNGAIYISEDSSTVSESTEPDPFKVAKISKYYPQHSTLRIPAQSALFTIHPDPRVPIKGPLITKLIIPNHLKANLRDVLYHYGIHRASLFPDLDGQARFIQWLHLER